MTGPTSDTMKLIGNSGDSMFLCRAEEELNLDEFETDVDYDEQSVAFDIKSVAASFIGEHDCIFDQVPAGLNNERVKLMVTTEANAINQITSNTEFKAELIVERATTANNRINENIYVNCPKSGKHTSVEASIKGNAFNASVFSSILLRVFLSPSQYRFIHLVRAILIFQ